MKFLGVFSHFFLTCFLHPGFVELSKLFFRVGFFLLILALLHYMYHRASLWRPGSRGVGEKLLGLVRVKQKLIFGWITIHIYYFPLILHFTLTTKICKKIEFI